MFIVSMLLTIVIQIDTHILHEILVIGCSYSGQHRYFKIADDIEENIAQQESAI